MLSSSRAVSSSSLHTCATVSSKSCLSSTSGRCSSHARKSRRVDVLRHAHWTRTSRHRADQQQQPRATTEYSFGQQPNSYKSAQASSTFDHVRADSRPPTCRSTVLLSAGLKVRTHTHSLQLVLRLSTQPRVCKQQYIPTAWTRCLHTSSSSAGPPSMPSALHRPANPYRDTRHATRDCPPTCSLVRRSTSTRTSSICITKNPQVHAAPTLPPP